MASFHDEKANVKLICYFVSPTRLTHFMSVVGEELPPFPPLTARGATRIFLRGGLKLWKQKP